MAAARTFRHAHIGNVDPFANVEGVTDCLDPLADQQILLEGIAPASGCVQPLHQRWYRPQIEGEVTETSAVDDLLRAADGVDPDVTICFISVSSLFPLWL